MNGRSVRSRKNVTSGSASDSMMVTLLSLTDPVTGLVLTQASSWQQKCSLNGF
jgi:hypothetical protein